MITKLQDKKLHLLSLLLMRLCMALPKVAVWCSPVQLGQPLWQVPHAGLCLHWDLEAPVWPCGYQLDLPPAKSIDGSLFACTGFSWACGRAAVNVWFVAQAIKGRLLSYCQY